MPTTFAHVALNCQDMAAIERYYNKHFGFRRARVVSLGDTQIVFLKAGAMYLELFRADKPSPTPAPAKDGNTWPGVRHIAFQVENVDAKLAEMGSDARVTAGARHGWLTRKATSWRSARASSISPIRRR
jgi:glyoxylase I family protein